MSQPLLPWEKEGADHPQLVWRSKLDDKFLIEVHRTDNYSGTLYIFDHDKNDLGIASWDVMLSYGAMFGPDVADVEEWQKGVAVFIDTIYNKQ